MDAKRANLLSLPVEIRLQIYESAYDAKYIGSRLVWLDGYHLQINGSVVPDNVTGEQSRLSGSPYTLLRVCHRLRDEVLPMLPAMKDITFHLNNLTQGDLQDWLQCIPPQKLALIRRLRISGLGPCQFPRAQPTAICDRSLYLDLTAFEAHFKKDNFLDTLAQASGGRYNKQFCKGFYLVRRLDGCVHIPRAQKHPRGSIGQCNSVVDQQHAIADMVSDDGDVIVTRHALGALLDAVMRSQLPGGPGRRRMEG